MAHIHRFAATVLAILSTAVFGSPLDIPNVPLNTGVGVDPNIMLILDDSGSMQFEILPDSLTSSNTYFLFPRPSNPYKGSSYKNAYLGLDDEKNANVTLRSSTRNVLFYNPSVTYQPWRKADGSSYGNIDATKASYDPAGRNNCTINLKTGAMTGSNCSDSESISYPITFYVYAGSGDVTNRTNYTRYQYRNGIMYQWRVGDTREECTGRGRNRTCKNVPNENPAPDPLPWGRSVADEVQNFANWFSYYRSRILAVQAGVTNAFADLSENFRVGFCTINTCKERGATPNIAIPTTGNFSGTNKTKFFDTFTKVTIDAVGTPLREGLDWAGYNYQNNTQDTGPWGPKVTVQGTAKQLSCRQSFTILTTDGYWDSKTDNDDLPEFSGPGNSDGTDGPKITSADGKTSYQYTKQNPYQDSYSDTLADVAMNYWKNDLRTDLDNNVPTTTADPAFWQHMTTFALSLGVAGTLTYPDDLAAITAGKKSWPDSTQKKDATRVDDLWHAAVNGHGQFFAAQNPNEFAQGLKNALGAISDRTASASNLAVNLPRITSDTLVFQARYKPGDWTGELLAYPVTTDGGDTTPKWSASIPAVGSRNIFSWDGKKGITFDWSSLTKAQKTALGSQDIVDYLRGDQSKEVKNGGTLRNRKSLLGDIIHSSPVYVDNHKDGAERAQTVFVGANDGMLHAFDATNGQERFAYVPNAVITPALATLADPGYTHRYFVDGPIAVTWPALTPGKNILIASLGYGGKGIFALDVTNPKSFSEKNVQWELGNDPDLGLVTGEMVLSKTNDGHTAVIFGNSYNSTNEHAVLFIVDLYTGEVIKKIDTSSGPSNGLSAVIGFDANRDGTVDYIYAGDLQGNLWKFDLSSETPDDWDVAKYNGQKVPLFAAGSSQPITGRPMVGYNPADGSRWVFFGTGRYLTASDISDTSTQSWYGIIDDGQNAVTRSQLKERKIVARGTDPKTGDPVRAFELATSDDMNDKKGWYVDLDAGERMISSQVLRGSVLIASSIIPSDDPCTPGGSGYVNAIDAFTGAALGYPFFTDYGTLKSGGKDIAIGSIGTSSGMPGGPTIIGSQIELPLSSGTKNEYKIYPSNKRINWRELIRE